MSHTTTFGDFTFIHDGDVNPDSKITIRDVRLDIKINVPARVLLEFVADIVRNERIAVLEQVGYERILGLRGEGEGDE